MKKATIISVFLLTNCWSVLAQANKLPIPSKSFIEKAQYVEDAAEKYLARYLGKKSERALKTFDDSKQVCAREFEFKTGIILKTNSCSESGVEAVIIFPNYSKKEVVQFVDWFFRNDYSKWNKSKTRYQPKEDGEAGCYLEIRETKGKIILNYSCGC